MAERITGVTKKLEISFSGYNFDIYVKDRKTEEVIDAYLDVDPLFAGALINELLDCLRS